MVSFEQFWKKLELGKWREEVVQRQILNHLRLTGVLFLILIVYMSIFQLLQSTYLPAVPKIDLWSPFSITVSISIAIAGIALGFQSYFIQKHAETEIITYVGRISYQGIDALITLINKGKNVAVIRNMSLFAMKDRKGIVSSFASRWYGLPSFEVVSLSVIFQGWRVLREGEFAGIEEKSVKDAITKIASNLQDERDLKDLYIAVLIGDEEFELTDIYSSIAKQIVGGCKLGKCDELIKYAKGEIDDFPGLGMSGQRTYIGFQRKELKGLREGKRAQAELIPEIPPDVREANFEIWQKLDNIEKLLAAKKENNAKKKNGKSKV